MNGEFALTQTGTGDILTVTGSETGKNTVTFSATTVASNYTGGNGDDTVVFVQTTGAGVASANAVVGDGKNTVTANALTDGDLIVVGGSGIDTVNATAITDANVTLQLGDGNNVVVLGTEGNVVLDAATINIVTGAGNDTVSLLEKTTANTTVNLTLGGGTNTLVLDNVDYTLGTWSTSGLNAIEMLAGEVTVAASLVSGETIAVSATGTAGDIFAVKGTVATGETIDLSSLAMSQTINEDVKSTKITGTAGDDTIIGTEIGDAITETGGTNSLTGGLGLDTYTLTGGTNTVVIAEGDTGLTTTTADVVTTFTTGTDKLKLGVAGSATNYTEADASGDADLAALVATANGVLDGTVQYYFGYDINGGGAGALVIDWDLDGTADAAISLTGAGNAGFLAETDIIA
ncbi:hypothetical protein U5801_23135 [Lamprobacter modestohalophilus]|uniref:beta strand repeat-containing protein n=1 Tax=Lamprobacter modestohalophilus TaxID=1064514 RepID=UPI002ADED4FA|nr:hypothetical protein [Lamprobacter modestohalophilus]MEA1052681.1 hypothetical protein [Lamprobacter modestohalophilus]